MARNRVIPEDAKAFHFRMPRDTWLFLKKTSILKGMPMSEVCIEFIEKQRSKLDKKMEKIGEVADVE